MTTRFAVKNFGTALAFSGSAGGVTGTNKAALLFATSDFSISFWALNAGLGTRAVVAKRLSFTAPTAGYIIALNQLGKLIAEIDNGSGEVSITSTGIKLDRQWHFYTVTFDRDDVMSVYIDGVFDVASGSIAAIADITNTRNVNFAQDSNGTNKFGGMIDEIRFFNKVLKPAEISALYYSGIVPTGQVGSYLFDEGSGTVANDGEGGVGGTISSGTYSTYVRNIPRTAI